jgi:hypothetical protein
MSHLYPFWSLLKIYVAVKPSNCLHKGLLLSVLVQWLTQVATYSKPVLHAAEEVDLIWLTSLDQDFLRLVAKLGSEDIIGLCNT